MTVELVLQPKDKKRILLMPPLHVLGHKHNNYYTTVLQQEALKKQEKKKQSRQRPPQCLSYSFVLLVYQTPL